MMVIDTEIPNFDTHDFRDDVTASEVSGTGYTAGGVAITTTDLTLASGVLTYDAADASWSSSTIANAMGAVGYFGRGPVPPPPTAHLAVRLRHRGEVVVGHVHGASQRVWVDPSRLHAVSDRTVTPPDLR